MTVVGINRTLNLIREECEQVMQELDSACADRRLARFHFPKGNGILLADPARVGVLIPVQDEAEGIAWIREAKLRSTG